MTMTASVLQGWNRHKTRFGVAVADEADGLLYATGSSLHYVPDRVGPRMETLPVLLLLPSVTYQLSRLI